VASKNKFLKQRLFTRPKEAETIYSTFIFFVSNTVFPAANPFSTASLGLRTKGWARGTKEEGAKK